MFLAWAVLYLLVFSYSTSPLFDAMGTDPAIFRTIGLGLIQGKTPYLDLFDQKGPLRWCIEALGLSLSWRYGLFILQAACLWATTCLWFLTARLFTRHNWRAAGLALLAYAPLTAYYNCGNSCEEWMLPAISAAYYLAIRHFDRCGQGEEPPMLRLGVQLGLCFALVFFIRVNDALAQTGSVILGVFLHALASRRYSALPRFVAGCLISFAAVAAPFIAFYAHRQALPDLAYGMFTFSMKYAGGVDGFFTRLIGRERVALTLLPLASVLALSLAGYRKSLAFVLVPAATLTYFAMGPMIAYRYPAIATVPLALLAFAMLCDTHSPIGSRIRLAWLAVLALFFLYRASGLAIVATQHAAAGGQRQSVFFAQTDSLLSHIPQAERGQVWNYNLGAHYPKRDLGEYGSSYLSILVHDKIVQCNRLVFNIQAYDDPWLREQDSLQFERKRPTWIVATPQSVFKIANIEQALASDYRLVAQTDTTICDIKLYRLAAKR